MLKNIFTVAACAIVLASVAQPACALPPFKKAFVEKYCDPSKTDDTEKKVELERFRKLVNKTGCNVCHLKGKEKSEQNPYGKALAELIPGDAKDRLKEAGPEGKAAMKAEILKELDEAFDKVAKMPADKGGELYGSRLARGKLPYQPADDRDEIDDADDVDDDDEEDDGGEGDDEEVDDDDEDHDHEDHDHDDHDHEDHDHDDHDHGR